MQQAQGCQQDDQCFLMIACFTVMQSEHHQVSNFDFTLCQMQQWRNDLVLSLGMAKSSSYDLLVIQP